MKHTRFIVNIFIMMMSFFLLSSCHPVSPDDTFMISNISLEMVERSYNWKLTEATSKTLNYYDRTSSYLYAELIDDSYLEDNDLYRLFRLNGIIETRKRDSKTNRIVNYLLTEYASTHYEYQAINNNYSLGTLTYGFYEAEDYQLDYIDEDVTGMIDSPFSSSPFFKFDNIFDELGNNLYYRFAVVSRDIHNVEINKSDLTYDIDYRKTFYSIDGLNIRYNIKAFVNGEYIEVAEIVVSISPSSIGISDEEVNVLKEDSSVRIEELDPIIEYCKWLPEKFIETAEIVILHAYKNA